VGARGAWGRLFVRRVQATRGAPAASGVEAADDLGLVVRGAAQQDAGAGDVVAEVGGVGHHKISKVHRDLGGW
jgi:hypothetical protein